jgi:hypothetical protein
MIVTLFWKDRRQQDKAQEKHAFPPGPFLMCFSGQNEYDLIGKGKMKRTGGCYE